jgi:tetratricopeptide (TPR) repeat protein
MGIKQTDIMSFIEPESTGFYYDTARSFLERHANPESLLNQLRALMGQGHLDSCRDLIQMILREGHCLADSSEIYLLRAEVAMLQSDPNGEVLAWVQQAKMCKKLSTDVIIWDELAHAQSMISEGDYLNGQLILEKLMESERIGHLAQFELAYHLFWKNLDAERALQLLEDVTQSHPEFVKAWSCLGFVFNRFGLKTQAQQAFAHCIELDSNPERIKFYKQQLAS